MTASPQPMPPVLKRYWIAMIALTGLSIAWTAAAAALYKLRAPYGLTLRWGDMLYNDFLIFRPGFLAFGTSRFWSAFDYPFTYPAPVGVVFGILYKLHRPVLDYLLLCCIALLAGAWWFVGRLTARGISRGIAWTFTVTTLAMTWPLWTLVDTANIEGLVAIVLACGALAVWRERWLLGATLIGIAGAMKLFPLLLLALLLSKRRYKAFAWGIAVAVAVTIGSLAVLGPNIVEAQRHVDAGVLYVRHWIMFSMLRFAPAFDHSLWLPVRFAVISIDRLLHPVPAATIADRTEQLLSASLKVYLCVAVVSVAFAWFVKIRKLPLLNQLLALTVCAVLLPPISIDYTLIHLLLPFGLLCAYAADMARRSIQVKGLQLCFACFVPIFNADAFLNHKYLFAAEARTAGLIVLFFAAILNPLAWPAADGAAVNEVTC